MRRPKGSTNCESCISLSSYVLSMSEDYALSGVVAKPAVHLIVIVGRKASFHPGRSW